MIASATHSAPMLLLSDDEEAAEAAEASECEVAGLFPPDCGVRLLIRCDQLRRGRRSVSRAEARLDEIEVRGRDMKARPGDCLIVPKGEPHSYLATSAEGVRFLTITRGGGFFGLVREVGRAAKTDGLPEPSAPPPPEQQEALARIARKHGVEFVGPPLR
jgi:hypothetical protein